VDLAVIGFGSDGASSDDVQKWTVRPAQSSTRGRAIQTYPFHAAGWKNPDRMSRTEIQRLDQRRFQRLLSKRHCFLDRSYSQRPAVLAAQAGESDSIHNRFVGAPIRQ
jgi:hypothetical protein